MRKILLILLSLLIGVLINCGGGDDMPCITCLDDNAEYGCLTYDGHDDDYRCFYTTKNECRNYYDGELVNSCSDYPNPIIPIDPDPPYNPSSNSGDSDPSSNSIPPPITPPPSGNSSSSLQGDAERSSDSFAQPSSSSSMPSSSSSGTSSSSLVQVRPSSSSRSSPPPIYTDKGNSISSYRTQTIGDQVWMAENLNYKVEGSKCYGEGGQVYDYDMESYITLTSTEIQANCDTYGRLYDWSTAMALDASCNSTSCSGQVSAKHRGICPSGWHIPSNAEWDELMTAVGGSSTAGTQLKATSGWNSNGIVSLDSYGFSALPGGIGFSSGVFGDVGYAGTWWSGSENGYGAHNRHMYYDVEYVHDSNANDKDILRSVRCLQD